MRPGDKVTLLRAALDIAYIIFLALGLNGAPDDVFIILPTPR